MEKVMTDQEAVDIIIVSEQLSQIDFVERALKKHVISTHQSNQLVDIRRILTHESIDVVVVDDDEGLLGVGSVVSAIKDLHLSTPVLQLKSNESPRVFGDFIENGASLVCPRDDAKAILSCIDFLLIYTQSLASLADDNSVISDYRQKFDDLYQGLADPVCYLLDGAFVDCNPAFLRAFEVSDNKELQELTIMHFVAESQQEEFRKHLKMSARRDLSAAPVVFKLRTKLGNDLEYIIMSKPAKFNNEDVVQLYLRSTKESGSGGASLYDQTTGLANKEQMHFFLKQKQEEFSNRGGNGLLGYLFIQNYRDIWASDGAAEAEKLITAVSQLLHEQLSTQAEISRYTDDGILLFSPRIKESDAQQRLTQLIWDLDTATPEGMARMVEPVCYISFDFFDQKKRFETVIDQCFRTATNIAVAGGERVAKPTERVVAKKDAKNLETLQKALNDENIKLSFQPVASFRANKQQRFCEKITLLDTQGKPLDLELMMTIAERYQLMHHIDRWKITHVLNQLLGINAEKRETMQIFVSISADALKVASFFTWLTEQMQHTGLGGKYFVFEITVDAIQGAYSGAKKFVDIMRQNGAKIAIARVGGFSKENVRILDDFRPEFIKLDIREIDALDVLEEKETMEDFCNKAKEIKAVIIADHIQSSSQLARVWPYNIRLVQGEGITPMLPDMDFDFSTYYLA